MFLNDIRKVSSVPIEAAQTVANLTANGTWTKLTATMGGKNVWIWPDARKVGVVVLADTTATYTGAAAGYVINCILPMRVGAGFALWVNVPVAGEGQATVATF